MKELKKKIINSVSLVIAMIMSISTMVVPVSASEIVHRKTIEEHLVAYNDEISRSSSESFLRTVSTNSRKLEIQSETVANLLADGYEAYAVNTDTYDEVEEKLMTDLSDLGIEKSTTAIIVAHGENPNIRSTAESSFNYTYSGTTYKLRYLTVTASDNSAMSQTATINVLSSTSRQLLINCLDTAVSAVISSVSTTLGTVASICGLSVEDFSTSAPSISMVLNAAANWTRIYTQVWSSYDNAWSNGAFVSSVYINMYMSGHYYDSDTNKMQKVPTDDIVCTRRSSEFCDTTWRKQNGVIGYLNSTVYKDTVGNVQVKYGGTTKKTLYENF